MNIRWQRLNLYLLVGVAAASCGCQTSSTESKPKKLLSTLRLHLETSRDGTTSNASVPIYRQQPVMVNVEKMPFLTEAEVAEAKVVDVGGDFALSIKVDRAGAVWLVDVGAHIVRKYSPDGKVLMTHPV